MTGIRTSFEYELAEPIRYTEKSEGKAAFVEGQMLVLYAPSVKQMRHVQKLKAYFYAATDKTAQSEAENNKNSLASKEKEEKEDGVKINATFLLVALEKGTKDLNPVYDCFMEMICSSICKIEDKTNMTKPILDLLSAPDIENMLGIYLDNFLLQSFKKMIQENS